MKRPESKQPRKQRKFRARAPLHQRRKFLNVHISKELKAKLKTKKRTTLVKKGDMVRVTTGQNKGKVSKVVEVDYRKLKIYVEGVTRVNAKGKENFMPVDPSNVELVEANLDKFREKVLNRI